MPASKFGSDFAFLKKNQILSHDEILRVVRVSAGLGVSKIRLTGGEPLLDPDIAMLIERLSAVPGIEDIALTTNGVLLEKVAKRLVSAGLQRVNISLDSLDSAVFQTMSGQRGSVDRVLRGVSAASAAGLAPIKINVVVRRQVNDHTVLDLLDYFRGSGHIVRFIEYMDVGNINGWRDQDVVPSAELLERINGRWPLQSLDPNYRGEVASRYQYVDGAGEIGFVSSITDPFCGKCSRARLSADGVFYTCLFATHGKNLRELLRGGCDDDRLAAAIRGNWETRGDRYSQERSIGEVEAHRSRKVEMYRVGG